MVRFLLGSMLVLSVTACANHLQSVDDQLTTALAGEPVVITKAGGGLFKGGNGTITLTSSADYMYPSGGFCTATGRASAQ
jgi:hypothetical protein